MPGGRENNPRGGSVPELDSGATAWILTSAALVLLMTPGLALFYGGMTRSKSVLNMMMMSFGAIGLVSLLWVFYGYSIAFGDDIGGITGDLSAAGLRGMLESGTEGGIPDLLFAGFQLMFAVITVALISGAIADRARFGPWLLFAGLWATLVYFPVAHWVWGGGWIFELGVLDFAGGTAVHINAGAAALALALVLGRRVGWPKDSFKPHNLPMVLLGAGLLWFGWFGFNAGSALAANGTAAVAFINTQVATAAAVLGWLLVEKLRDGKPTTLGAASGAIAGLVAITPACAFLEPLGAIALGVIAGVVCALAVGLKYRLKYDDSLDVVAVHMVGGIIGSLLIGFLAMEVLAGEGNDGLLYGGGVTLLGKQALGSVAVLAYSFVVAYLIGFVIDKTIGFRASADAEVEGIDNAEHAESAYEFSSTGGGGGAFAAAGIGTSAAPKTEPTEPVSEKVAG
ncbi:ammonium transporter [Micromonospora andamanensis]|uniref:ammonium transporter n=1 Tax=Micromonospora andamanensis TaxID=1287068 RepID=UPI00195021E8|nr:ammonium transporter [Micromonospora andamanensis]